MMESILMSLMGGVIIGVSTALFLMFNGRVTGISGILNGFLGFVKGERLWRGAFLFGLIAGGFVISRMVPGFFENTAERSFGMTIIAGLLVGYGTILGSGCTSGHGVCGIARLSVRSLIATAIFMAAGMFIATLLK